MFSGSQKYPTLPIDYTSMVTTDPARSYTPRTLTLSSSQIVRQLLND